MNRVGFMLASLSSLMASASAVFAADAALVEAAKKEGHVTWYTVQIVEGQRIFADAGELPVHPAVKARDPLLIPDGMSFKGSFLTPEELDRELVPWTRMFDEYFR